MLNENTNNCHFLIQEGRKMRSFSSKGKDKDGLTVVPLMGDHMQSRLRKSKQISPGKEVEIPTWRKKGKK